MKTAVIYFIVIIYFLVSSCIYNKKISYNYTPQVDSLLNKFMDNPIMKTEHGRKYIYAIVNECNTETIIIINNYPSMPPSMFNLLKRSNRFLKIDNRTIPIMFETDVADKKFKLKKYNFPLSGFFVKLDNNNEIIDSGLLF
jgi:hypothetical protein